MRQPLFTFYSGPLIALGGLVAIACLSGSWYINRLQADLARAVKQDAAGLEAAVELQVQLRHLRVHSVVLVADRSEARWKVVRADLARVDEALNAVQQTVVSPDDAQLVETVVRDYSRYKKNLDLDHLPPSTGPVSELATWSDEHHMADLLAPCQELADRQRDRMQANLQRTETQTAWAGRVLFCLGFAGVLGGILSGYVAARALNRRVTQLSIRVQAVQAQLDQEVGAMTVQKPSHFGELDEQLDQVIRRVSAVCQRLQEQERDLLRAEQLAAVGQLAAGVAHEVRNPLTGVKLLLQAAVRLENPMPLTPDRLHRVLQEVARIERTVQGLMDFAHMPAPDRRPQDIRPAVEAAVNVSQSRAELKSVAVRMDAVAIPLNAAIDRDQFLSLVTNLLFNAIDATPAGGEVVVSTNAGPNGMIRLVVSDGGRGIDPLLAGKLFTPFSTTKPSGTGLGLTIARRIAREHGGDLTAADRADGGACFTLTLPSAEALHV